MPLPALLVATSNPGKLREIRGLLEGLPLRLLTLADFPGIIEPEEPGETFAENARDKARYYALAAGTLTVADDSGLEIDAIDGAPGVQSARFPGETYAEKFAGLFRLLDGRGADTSTARFVCALALVRGDDVLFEAEGAVEGVITRQPRGTNGFGYDPIFLFPPLGRTLAEIADEAKAAISHRGHAFRALRAYLEHHAQGLR